MSLISKQDLIKISGLSKLGFLQNPIASSIMRLTKLHQLNKFYDGIKHRKDTDFFNSFLEELHDLIIITPNINI